MLPEAGRNGRIHPFSGSSSPVMTYGATPALDKQKLLTPYAYGGLRYGRRNLKRPEPCRNRSYPQAPRWERGAVLVQANS